MMRNNDFVLISSVSEINHMNDDIAGDDNDEWKR